MSAPQTVPAPVVLVVDDEPMVLRLMERTLGSAGYQVHVAPDGLRALALASESPPDVLVTDLRMEPINGADLARLVTSEHPNTRVLLVSGYDPEHTELAMPFLRKPFSPDQLVHAVEQLVASRPHLDRAG
jgi:two-component system, OmpR family, alkaline phosphatase synthesis response regulator PhoP